MGNISSINFKNANLDNQLLHNTIDRPKYAIGGEVKYNKEPLEAYNLCKEMIEKAKSNYAIHCKAKNKRFQATNYIKSAVVNIKESTTMDDLEKLANKLNEVYGFQCYQISIHRDEGHINDNGEKVINHHAHMEFVTLDKETGFNRFKEIGPKQLSEIQTEIADLLEMKRGEYVRDSKRKRIEPRTYAQLKEQEKANTRELKADLEKVKAENKQLKADLVSQKAVNTAFEEIRQLMIADGISTADDYKELAKYKKEAQAQAKSKELTKEQLNNQIAQIQQSYNDKLKAKDDELKAKDEEIEKLEKAIEPIKEYTEPLLDDIIDIYTKSPADAGLYIKKLWREREQDRQDYKRYKQELKEEYQNKLADNEPTNENKADDVKDKIKTLEKENNDLRAENKRLKSTIDKLSTLKEYIATYFHDAVSKYLSFMKNTNQLDKAIEIEPKEQQLTAKKEPEKPKNRGFSRC